MWLRNHSFLVQDISNVWLISRLSSLLIAHSEQKNRIWVWKPWKTICPTPDASLIQVLSEQDVKVTMDGNNFSPQIYSVADPGFPRRRNSNSQGGEASLLFGQLFLKNCMKMKEIGARRKKGASLPPWILQCQSSTTATLKFWNTIKVSNLNFFSSEHKITGCQCKR